MRTDIMPKITPKCQLPYRKERFYRKLGSLKLLWVGIRNINMFNKNAETRHNALYTLGESGLSIAHTAFQPKRVPVSEMTVYCVEWDVKLYHTILYHTIPKRVTFN